MYYSVFGGKTVNRGCAATKEEDGSGRLVFGGAYNCFHPNKPVLREKEELERQKEEFHDQYQQTLLSRISSYQKGANAMQTKR